MGFRSNPGVVLWVTWVTSVALGRGAVTPVTFGSVARVTSAAASKAAETLGFAPSVTLVTLFAVGEPAHAAKRLAGIVGLHIADDAGRQDIEPHRSMPRNVNRFRSFTVAGADDQPAFDHRPGQRRRIKALGDFSSPLLRQYHVFPAPLIVEAAEPGTVDHPLDALLPS